LGRALYYVPNQSPLHPGRVLTTFGFISFIIEGLNGWGASYSANQSLSHSEMEAGHALIKTSLLLQLVVAICFVSLAAMFHRRCVTHGVNNDRLKSTLLTLYISITLIVVRTIFRTVEYFGIANYKFDDPNFDPMSMSPLMRYEVFFYVFEAALMFCNNVMFNMRHPRRYLPENNRIYLSQDGVTEVEGPGYEDPRPLWRTILDPFDVAGVSRRKKESPEPKFWEARGPETK
jgi:magnesium-transporting ATPase (P-type)